MAPTKRTKQVVPATKLSTKAGIKKSTGKKSARKTVTGDVIDEEVEAPIVSTKSKTFADLSDELLLKIFGFLVPTGLVIEPLVTKGLRDAPSAILTCKKWFEVILDMVYGQNSFYFRKISDSMVFLSSIGHYNSKLITNIVLGQIWSAFAPLLRQPSKFREPSFYARAERYPAYLAKRCPDLKTLRISQLHACPDTAWKLIKLKRFQAELDNFPELKHISYRPGTTSNFSMLLLSKGPAIDTETDHARYGAVDLEDIIDTVEAAYESRKQEGIEKRKFTMRCNAELRAEREASREADREAYRARMVYERAGAL